MCAIDLVETFDEMEGVDFLKILGGAVAGVGTFVALPVFGAIGTVTLGGALLGSLLGAGAGVALVAEDEEKRKDIQTLAKKSLQTQWERSAAMRQAMVECAKSMDGYLQAVKLIYALAASCEDASEEEDTTDVKTALDAILATWLPQDLKDMLQLIFQKRPTFYDVSLMIRSAFKEGLIDGNKFMKSAEDILHHLDDSDIIDWNNIKDQWDAFKVGLMTSQTNDQGENCGDATA